MLEDDVKLPERWAQRASHHTRTASNRDSLVNLSLKPKEILNNQLSFEEPAGVSSGFIERFELEKYNPKILQESKPSFSQQRPYTTQTGMNAFRLNKERQMVQEYMDEWDKLNPYFVDRILPDPS